MMSSSYGNILGVDRGSKYIWLAYVNPNLKIILPIWYIENDPSMFFNLWEIIQRYKIWDIVVWKPSDKKIAKAIESFVEQLKYVVGDKIKIEIEDEDFSSVEASSLEGDFAKTPSTDTIAAMIILKRYLQRLDWLDK